MFTTKPHQNPAISFDEIMGADDQIETLYNLLKNRSHRISHKSLPRLKDHIRFVRDHPYRYWAIVLVDEFPIGTFYIQDDNSIGINIMEPSLSVVSEILKYINVRFRPLKEIQSKVPPYFYINLPFKDEVFHDILRDLKAEPIQISYKLK